MSDFSNYLSKFFVGPFASRDIALSQLLNRGDDATYVIGSDNNLWWGKAWPKSNFVQQNWPEGFHLYSKADLSKPRLRLEGTTLFTGSTYHQAVKSLFGQCKPKATSNDFLYLDCRQVAEAN